MASKTPLKKAIKGKLYRNSQCDICDCYLCEVKSKEHPQTKELFLVCRECWVKLNIK